MTEFSPFFEEEFASDSAASELMNILTTSEWREFRDVAEGIDQSTVIYSNDDPASEEVTDRIKDFAITLAEKLSWEYDDQLCCVLGLAYPGENCRSDVREPVIVDSDKLVFCGPDVAFIAGRWRAVVKLYNAQHTEELPHGFCYLPPDIHHVMDLRIKPRGEDDDVEDVVTLLDDYVVAARKFVANPKFLKLPGERQREVLQKFIDDLDEAIPSGLRELEVPVQCSQYYTRFDIVSDRPLTPEMYTDLRPESLAKNYALRGEIVRFEYPELQDIPPDKQLQLSDFINNGASCMVLRNEEMGVTFYIFPQSISEID